VAQASPELPSSRPSRRAQLRAAAITLVLLVECTAALPRNPFDQERLARPEGQRLIGWIESGMRSFGRAADRQSIAAALITATSSAVSVRNALLAPFGPFFHYTSTHQQWGLFIAPKRESFRLHVDARGAHGPWIAMYRAPGGVDADRLAPALRYRRVRGIYHPRLRAGARAEYPGFVNWLAGRVFAAHPDYEAVRVRMERVAIGAPGTPLRTLGFAHEIIRKRTRKPELGA
jgi:hypothetical protein